MKTTIHIYRDEQKQWRFRAVAGNGEILCQSEGYKRRIDAHNTVARLFLSDDPIYIKVEQDPESRKLGNVPEDND